MVHALDSHGLKRLEHLHNKLHQTAIALEAASAVVGVAMGYGVNAINSSLFGAPEPRPLGSFGPTVDQQLHAMRARVIAVPFATAVTPVVLRGATSVLRIAVEGYGREQELDADIKATTILSDAGYNPRAIISFLKRLAFLQQKSDAVRSRAYGSKLINAEPGIETRLEHLTNHLGE